MTTYVMAYITAPSMEVAESLAESLVSERLAACVNLIPQVNSIYTWQGEVNHDTEILMIAKTTQLVFEEKLIARVETLHPYDVPEIIAVPLVGGSPAYLSWISEMVA
jgi:periplasmic divalent cation tolerance protein